MLFNIIFLSSLLPLTPKLLQNPNLNYLFRTLNLTHTLLNASNPQLAKDCSICLSITPLGDSALPTSILDWTTGNMSLHHSYRGEPLFVSYLKYLHTSDQIGNSDIFLESLLTKLPSFNKKPPIGSAIAQRVTCYNQLLFAYPFAHPAPFCIPETVHMTNPWAQSLTPRATIPPPYSLPLERLYIMFLVPQATLTFTGWFPSAYSSTSPIVGATLAGSLSALEQTIKPLPRLLFTNNFSCWVTTPGLFFLCGKSTYLCLPTNWTGICTLVYSSPNILIAPIDQPLPIPLTHK